MDVHALDPGDPFPLRIQTELQSCDVVIALIGHNWGGQDFSNGRSRIEDPSDFVRAELTMAIDNGLSIIPVLVDGSEISKTLPSPLTELLRRHTMPLHHQTFDADVESLYRVLDKYSSHAQVWRVIVASVAIAFLAVMAYLVIEHFSVVRSNWDGVWVYTFQGIVHGQTTIIKGKLTLVTHSSHHVEGHYSNEGGRNGSVEGTLTLNRSRINGLWTSGSESGRFYFSLEPDRFSFRGAYSTDPDVPAGENPHSFWNGTRRNH